MKQVEDVLKLLQDNIGVLKTTAGLGREDVAKMQASIQAKIDKSLEAVRKEQQKQKLQEEAARLKKLAEEMEKKRKEKEEAEKARIAAEAEAKLRKEMEAQAKKDAEQDAKEEEAARIKAEKQAASKKGNSKEAEADRKAAQEAAMLEQERRDQELAMRLAMDAANPTGALSEDAQKSAATHAMGGAKRKVKVKTTTHTFANKKQEALHKKHDLSKWKYADLRDTINTSCDIDLLEACREEFHRRLKVYHAWKMKNVNKSKTKAQSRNPAALTSAAASRGAAPPPPKKKKTADRPQRFFRIPFVKPGEKKTGAKKGWWYAHFDGQWIARQMELHPEKAPVLLTAGRDDMEMCELSLEETGLTRKRGAEILPREFEAEWSKHGGDPYVSARSKGGKRK